MPKSKKNKNEELEELLLTIKLCCDRAKAHMKVREYDKALQGYNQSFVRVGLKVEEEEEEPPEEVKKPARRVELPPEKPKFRGKKAKIDSEALKKKKPKDSFIEIYTDKDRAAAVSAGSFDIKQSLKLKRKRDRADALLLPEEADPSSLIALGLKESKSGNVENAIQSISRALDLNPNDINALVARSKCFLLLGEPINALQDAEAALALDKNNIRATYQKAESLYYLGQFEQSLMFFHRGFRARPELSAFRLGVQKTQEAIENTIGAKPKPSMTKPKKPDEDIPKQVSSSKPPPKPKTSKISNEKRNARKLLGELCVDKEYLENLLNHPDLKKADTNTENISVHAKDAVDFLNKRQEFWRQQRPCTALPNQKNIDANDLPAWF